jgi:hypothetical protein
MQPAILGTDAFKLNVNAHGASSGQRIAGLPVKR